jgi:hypothetical protein
MFFLSDFVSKTSKIFFFLIVIALSTNSYSQWWVDGGNLIWPHGDVTINKNLFLKGFIKLDRPSSVGFTDITTSVDDSLAVASNHIANNFNIQLAIDNYTAKNIIQNGLITSNTGVVINQSGGHFDNNFSASANMSTCYVYKTTGDTIPNIFLNKSRIFTGSSGNYLKNLYAYYSRADSWVNLNIEKVYSFYSDGNSFGSYANVSDLYHFYGAGDYPSYFGGAMVQKVYTPDVSNPPTRSELGLLFGNPDSFDPGYNVFIDDNGEGHNFYHIVSDGSHWWVFTASAAP